MTTLKEPLVDVEKVFRDLRICSPMPEVVREERIRGEKEAQIPAVKPVLPCNVSGGDDAVIPEQQK